MFELARTPKCHQRSSTMRWPVEGRERVGTRNGTEQNVMSLIGAAAVLRRDSVAAHQAVGCFSLFFSASF